MKKHLLTALLGLFIAMPVVAQDFLVENYLGINCLKHTVEANESFYKVAQKYFVRPSTLALVNNINETESITAGRKLYIPLTETNFYNSNGLENSKFAFKPIYYEIQGETNFSEIAIGFFVTAQDLQGWNPGVVSIASGKKLKVGWLKYEKSAATKQAPLFVRKEKVLFGNAIEREEARKEINEGQFVTKKDVSFPDYSLPDKTIPSEVKKKDVELTVASKKKQNNILEKKEPKVVKRKLIKSNEKPKVVTKKIPKAKRIVRKEKEFNKPSKTNKIAKVKKTKKDFGIWSKIKGLTKNSYVRDKERASITKQDVVKKSISEKKISRKEVVKKVDPIVTKKPIIKKVEPIVKTKSTEKKVIPAKVVKTEEPIKVVKKIDPIKIENTDPTVINKVGVQNIEPNIIEKNEGPVYVENKLLRLTLLKSMKGKVSFFYSGTAGAKFYVFTNLAGKGGIIKITNLSNTKYILAQVIGPMPEADRKRGVIVKLSDNSRKVIGSKYKSFTGKVNY